MNTEVTEFKVSDFAEKVKAKIKASFVDLIPEEKWTALVNKELEFVMAEKIKADYGSGWYDNKESIHAMIRSKIQELIKEKINSDISLLLETHYDMEKQEKITSDLIKKMIIENAGEIFANMINSAISTTVCNLQDNVNNPSGY